jgi:hypothetical protein
MANINMVHTEKPVILTLTLTVYNLVSLNIILFTHLYLWFYSIVITLKHGQNCKHAYNVRWKDNVVSL